jgi:hypothetical protein
MFWRSTDCNHSISGRSAQKEGTMLEAGHFLAMMADAHGTEYKSFL